MKRILLTISLTAVSAMTLFGQGRVNFNNYGALTNPITVGIYNQGASGGYTGAFVGNNHSVQLWWAAGIYPDYQSFFAANLSKSLALAFFGTTGGNPTTDGAGLFDGGTVQMGGPAGIYTMQAVAWYNNNGQFPTYFHALAAGVNIGQSQLIQVDVTEPPVAAPNVLFPSFTVGALAPEPSSIALSALGATCLLLLRRKHKRQAPSQRTYEEDQRHH